MIEAAPEYATNDKLVFEMVETATRTVEPDTPEIAVRV